MTIAVDLGRKAAIQTNDLPSMTPGESHNEWYQYYCSNNYLFKSDMEISNHSNSGDI